MSEIPAPLLKQIARQGMCKKCFRAFWWFFTANGAAVPFDSDGTPHRQTCGSASAGVASVGGEDHDNDLDALPPESGEGLLDRLP